MSDPGCQPASTGALDPGLTDAVTGHYRTKDLMHRSPGLTFEKFSATNSGRGNLDQNLWGIMTLVKDLATVVPAVLLSAAAVLGMAVLIGLSSWDLPVRSDY